ncbi:MAG: 4Fe-4S ferredoxin [Candidatus Schekmanbacteria bacterium]|nr:MAG: 4Fe-4S ferredoxin [Candidatus Schekmanbacteria bacterium]
MKRKIVIIDEEKCTGCGDCIPKCHEGALQIIDGKARLVAEKYCDGLGDCLGSCSFDAIRVEEREVSEDYDEEAVRKRLESMGKKYRPKVRQRDSRTHNHMGGGCPSAVAREITRNEETSHSSEEIKENSELRNWPVQISLVAPQAPYFNDAHLLIAADCVPFSYAGFHRRFLKDKVLLIGCPKLDDAQFYMEKFTEIFKRNSIKKITLVHMEVPCCFGMEQIVNSALEKSGKTIPLEKAVVSIEGKIL